MAALSRLLAENRRNCTTLEEEYTVARRQLNLIAAQSLLKAASDLAPSRSAIDSGSVEGELAVGDGWGTWDKRRVGDHDRIGSPIAT